MISQATPQIEARGLVKTYGEHRVMNGLDLCVNSGETLVILGGSGSGKGPRSHVHLPLMHEGRFLVIGSPTCR